MERGGRKKSGHDLGPEHDSSYFDDRDLLFTKPDFDYEDSPGTSEVTRPKVTTNLTLSEMEATAKIFEDFGVGKCSNRDNGPKLIDPVTKLDDCKRYRPPTSTAEDGSPILLQLRMIKQWPSQQEDWRPLFEMANLSQSYDDMEREMQTTYERFEHVISLQQVHKGFYGVLKIYDQEQTMRFKRIRMIMDPMKFPDGTPHTVEVELIDDHFITTVCSQDNIFYLDKSFAALPPKVTSIQMEGMSNYKNNGLFRRFVMWTSDEFLFEGELQAEVQPSGKVVVWSEQFPRGRFPYGINGFITQSMIELTRGKVMKLPSVGDFKDGVFVVHADDEGFIWVQFQNDISAHLLEICDAILQERLVGLRGAVTLAEIDQSTDNDIYFAPHAKTGGTYYRAIVDHSKERIDDVVPVKFIDYGDTDCVAANDLIRAGEVHYLLPHFPPIAVRVHLQKIKALNAQIYQKQINSEYATTHDNNYTIHVVKEATAEVPAEVTLFPSPNPLDGPCLNYQLKDVGLAEEIDPTYKYGGHKVNRREVMWSCTLKLYLGMGHGHRLVVGEELKATVTYDGTMRALMFLTPSHRVPKREDLEVQLKKSYERQPRMCHSTVVPGAGVICHSRLLKRECRGLVLREDVEVSSSGKRWRVYLVDYGILENFGASDMSMLKPVDVNLPALGVRIKLRKLPTKKAVQRWWLDAIGGLELETHAKIIAISNDSCGEVAKVDFPTMEIPVKWSKKGKVTNPGSTPTTESGGGGQEPFPKGDKGKECASGTEVTSENKKIELGMEDKPSETIVLDNTLE